MEKFFKTILEFFQKLFKKQENNQLETEEIIVANPEPEEPAEPEPEPKPESVSEEA